MSFESELKQAKDLCKTEPDEALRICNTILNEDFDGKYGQMALFMAAYIMLQAERYGLAYQMYQRCAQLNPNISEIYSNMGMCLEESDPGKARKMFQKASHVKPDNANAYANEALICLQTNKAEKCIQLCDKALSIDPTLKAAKHNKGLAQLMLRKWSEGWRNYFDTVGVKHRERRDYGLPEWNGEPGTVIVYGEQGVGDEIMFSSCLPDIIRTNKVIFDCDSRLEELFKRSFDIPIYGTRFKKETPLLDNNKADYQCAIGQLPHFYRNSEKEFPGTPYLKPCPDQSIMWRALFDTFKGKKIGVAWSGGLVSTGKKKRSFNIEDFEPLFNDNDTFISLEYNPVDEEAKNKYKLKTYSKVTKKGGDIDDLAALISQLDYVVTACTTVVYIAGALGIPCYVLVPKEPGYRYHNKGSFPWYKSVKLIRQSGTWRQTMKKVKDAENIYRLRPSRDSGLPRSMSIDTESVIDSGLIHAN
jgi:hypothetical protein